MPMSPIIIVRFESKILTATTADWFLLTIAIDKIIINTIKIELKVLISAPNNAVLATISKAKIAPNLLGIKVESLW
jgi:hypothetical protein